MTDDQAMLEAEMRWGGAGWAVRTTSGKYRVCSGTMDDILGESEISWEDAFSNAEGKQYV